MGPLRIAILLPHLGVYGGIRRFLELGAVWVRRGHEVAIFLPRQGEGHTPWLPFGGELRPVEELRSGTGWDVLLSPHPSLFVEAEAPGALRVFYAVGAPWKANEAWKRADLILANSLGMLRFLARHGVHAEHTPGGVNTEFFHPLVNGGAPEPRSARPVRVLVYGRVSRPRKGVWTAVRAVENAALAGHAPVELVLFDTPPDKAPLPALPRGIRIPHRWVLRPSQEELRGLYRDADLFVSAERKGAWCNTAAEAMACGTAVACTRTGTLDFAVDGDTAAVSRWPWTWALARKIRPLLQSSDLRRSLADRARSRIEEFSWERTADRIEGALEKALRKGMSVG